MTIQEAYNLKEMMKDAVREVFAERDERKRQEYKTYIASELARGAEALAKMRQQAGRETPTAQAPDSSPA